MSIKEQIRAEIERRKELLENGTGHPEVMKRVEGAIKAYDSILAFLDTLPEQPVLPGIYEEGIPGRDFIPVEWVDACERYGKWKIVRAEQPEEGLEEAAEKSASQYYVDGGYSPFPNVETAAHEAGFIAGAEWMKSKYEK